jgi:hypothetical protein
MRPPRNFLLSQILDIGLGSAKIGEMAIFWVVFGGRYLGPRKSDRFQILESGSKKYGASFGHVEKIRPIRVGRFGRFAEKCKIHNSILRSEIVSLTRMLLSRKLGRNPTASFGTAGAGNFRRFSGRLFGTKEAEFAKNVNGA